MYIRKTGFMLGHVFYVVFAIGSLPDINAEKRN